MESKIRNRLISVFFVLYREKITQHFRCMDLVKYTKDSRFQRIKASYLDETFELDEKDLELKERLIYIWGLRVNNKYSPHQAVELAMKEKKIARATAYRDYALSMQLMGDIDQADKAAERKVLAEAYWNLYQRCINCQNFDGARKALDSYKSLYDFGDDGQKLDPKKLEASVYRLILPRGATKMINAMFESGVVDFNSLGAEDVDFKEVTDNEEDLEEQDDE